MPQKVVLSGLGDPSFRDALRASLLRERPRAIAIASAFVSMEGVRQLAEILKRCGEPECRLIAGTDNAVTHPEALYAARDYGWKLRLGKRAKGIFHPKLIVAGQHFSRNGTIQHLSCVYVGSSNLTAGGFSTNVECGLIANAEGCLTSAADSFAELWKLAQPASENDLRNYAAIFADRSRSRPVSVLADLGVNDSRPLPPGSQELRVQQPPIRPALGAKFAIAAWTGLESFTGEYRFQIEFPRDAGKVISQLARAHVQPNERIDVYCPDDESVRQLQYKFYTNNSMFRLNVPNDVPGVEWARANRTGIAIVEKGLPGGAPLRIRLLKPGAEVTEIVGRSATLGTWGRTSTRAYGWY